VKNNYCSRNRLILRLMPDFPCCSQGALSDESDRGTRVHSFRILDKESRLQNKQIDKMAKVNSVR
jgi:hypothetical protein